MLRRIARDPRNLPFVLAMVAGILVVPEIPSPACRPTSGWRGWYVLLYREAAADAVEAALPLARPGSVSRVSATARIDAFSEIEVLPIADLDARLDPLDPRMDGWLAGAGDYFRAGNAGPLAVSAYVPATRGRIETVLRLGRAFRAAGVPRDGWRLVELDPLAAPAAPAAALVFATVVAWWLGTRIGRGLLLAAAGVLVWLPGLLNGGPADLCICCLSLYLWLPGALEEERDIDGRRSLPSPGGVGMRIGVLLAAAAAVIAADDAAVYRSFRMAASTLGLALLAELAWSFPRMRPPARRPGHRFAPVPILSPRKPSFVPLAAGLAAALLVAAPSCLSQLRLALPRPVSLAPAASRKGIEDASRARGEDSLPGLADAVSHAVSLQTAAFGTVAAGVGGTGGAGTLLPPQEGRVLLLEYADGSAPTSLVEAPRTVVRFEPGWLDRVAAASRAGTVERLLVDQRRAVEVRTLPLRTTLVRALPAALVWLLLLGAPLAGPAARRLLMRLGLWAITEPARRRRTR